MSVLKGNVIVEHPETGAATLLQAGTSVPAWAADQISNPKLIADDDGETAVMAEPPRHGRGSGLESWVAYAESIGVDVPDDSTRDEIIAAIDARA